MHADADAIWNRACDLMAGEHLPDARRGDHALADALALDSTIQANGVAQALETDVSPGIAGLRWLGLDHVADALEHAQGVDLQGLTEEAERDLDDGYVLQDVESQIRRALDRRLGSDADAFMPL